MISPANRPTILVVDDEADLCSNLADIFEDLGFHVETAHDGESALERIRGRPFDVVVLDLKMPGMDGLEVYRRIKQLRAGTATIVLSAHAHTPRASEALATGAWRVLAKPVQVPALLGLIEEAVGQPLVLVVDDDRELCANLWDLLRDRGYRVELAHDETEAAEHLRSTRFQVALVDLKLPAGDGGRVLRLLRSGSPATRSILITAARGETDPLVSQVLREGADAVCYKPLDLASLLRMLDPGATTAAAPLPADGPSFPLEPADRPG